MITQVKIGPQVLSEGGYAPARGGRTGDLIVTQGHGRYYEAVKQGRVYIGCNVMGTPVTTQAGLSATTPALTLYNPIGSSVDLVLLSIDVCVTAAPAAASFIALANNVVNATAPATTTNATMVNAKLGAALGNVGQAYAIATLAAAPIVCRYIGFVEATGGTDMYRFHDDVDGAIIVPAGVAVSIQAKTAIALVCAFCWEEQAV